MKIPMNVLCRVIDRPGGNNLIVIHRHYCSQMYMHGKCTTFCQKDCGDTLRMLFEKSRGEFILNQNAMLVTQCRNFVSQLVQTKHQAVTPINALGEAIPESDPFAQLAKEYEATSTFS